LQLLQTSTLFCTTNTAPQLGHVGLLECSFNANRKLPIVAIAAIAPNALMIRIGTISIKVFSTKNYYYYIKNYRLQRSEILQLGHFVIPFRNT